MTVKVRAGLSESSPQTRQMLLITQSVLHQCDFNFNPTCPQSHLFLITQSIRRSFGSYVYPVHNSISFALFMTSLSVSSVTASM